MDTITVVTHRPFRVAAPTIKIIIYRYSAPSLITTSDLAKAFGRVYKARDLVIGGGVIAQSSIGSVVSPAVALIIMGYTARRSTATSYTLPKFTTLNRRWSMACIVSVIAYWGMRIIGPARASFHGNATGMKSTPVSFPFKTAYDFRHGSSRSGGAIVDLAVAVIPRAVEIACSVDSTHGRSVPHHYPMMSLQPQLCAMNLRLGLG